MLRQKQTQIRQLSTRNYILLMMAALVLYAISASLAAKGSIDTTERSLFYAVYNLPHLPSVFVLAITQLGSAWFFLTLVTVLLASKTKSLALRLSIVGVVTYIMVELSKNLVGRPRPEFLLHDVTPRENFVTGLGFPSGHTALITVVGFMLLPYLPKRWRPLVPSVIIMVGLSRIYLGVHSPLDVIGGFAVGLVVSLAYYLGINLAKHIQVAKRPHRT